MLQTIKKGFTLIELLVVITIIGILATGATTVYTSQIQKARDTTRINDIKALQSGVEQVYQDSSEYPHSNAFATDVSVYVPRLPSDPKHAETCNNGGAGGVDCGYAYTVGPDSNNILYGVYEISTAFENKGNIDNRAIGDNGSDDRRLEIGLDGNLNTVVNADAITTVNLGACSLAGAEPGGAVAKIVINGNPTSADECNG